MNFRRLKWLAILAPIGFVAILEYARYALGPELGSWQGHLLMDGVALAGALFFYGAVFSLAAQMQHTLEQQNRELEALQSAGLDVVSELSLDTVLQKVVDLARNLIGTRYGALALVDEEGRIRSFVTSGIDPEQRQQIGEPPIGRGLLGIVMLEGQRLRIGDMEADARASGLPAHHPTMRSLLAVPILCSGPSKGNLYLSEKLDGTQFTEDEERILARFATQAAIAVDNARLHAQVRNLAIAEERLRLAHEMHDGQAQVLAYVNTKVQAVQEFLRQDRCHEAAEQLEQLAAAAREVYADVREGILGLRAATSLDDAFTETLRLHLEPWQDQCGIKADLVVGEEPHLRPDVELQLQRIVQEALANVRKHSGAERVKVEVHGRPGGVQIAVEDDGRGFNPDAHHRSPAPRFGLATMRERAEAIGARLSLRTAAGAGTRIEVTYPAG